MQWHQSITFQTTEDGEETYELVVESESSYESLLMGSHSKSHQKYVSDSSTSCNLSQGHSTLGNWSRNPLETASNDIQRNGVPPRSRSRLTRFPPPLTVPALASEQNINETRSHMSEWVPGNQTSLMRCRPFEFVCTTVGVFTGVAEPPFTYSGRNFTRRSSKASACRKKQTWSAESVRGRLFPRKMPTEETVSLWRYAN